MASSFTSNEPRIVIVGAGFAGLAAATTLVKSGLKNVVILEAMDYVGGRTHTVRPFGANIIEMGATWIHGQTNNPLYQLAKSQGLLAEEGFHMTSCQPGMVSPEHYFFTEHGERLPKEEVQKVSAFFAALITRIMGQSFKADYSSWSLGDFLDQEFLASGLSEPGGVDLVFEWCKRIECVDEAVNSMYEFALSQLGLYTRLDGPFFNCLGPKGYQAIVDVLVETLPSTNLRLGKPVKCIQWAGSSEKDGNGAEPSKKDTGGTIQWTNSSGMDSGGTMQWEGSSQKDAGGTIQWTNSSGMDSGGTMQSAGSSEKDSGGTMQWAGSSKKGSGGTMQWEGSSEKDADGAHHPVRVVCDDGEEYHADHTIVTVSLGCLKERAQTMFKPLLPHGKMEAIARLGFGTVAKIFLEFEEPFWPEDCTGIQLLWEKGPEDKEVYNTHKEEDNWTSDWFKKIGGFDRVARHQSVLCGWITGLAAEHMETLPEAEIGETCVR
ncbi:hypothetical protein NDU88_000292 [Pleurodeles waltl]|uniref:Amine oxidase domain-containing protein n=2 Tax=Pleurodeles waltl TaxID=8319 RepID=A0AAV7KMB5_PLEWA|nr:hypothetical protein NDU88_000292 [Pleurodeles waltl]